MGAITITVQRRTHADLAELAEIVTNLTQAGTHVQRHRVGWKYPNRTGPIFKDHETHQPSLLTQLRDCVTDRPQVGRWNVTPGGTARGVLPHFDADAFDRLEAISRHVDSWNARFGIASASMKTAQRISSHLMAVDTLIINAGIPLPFPVGTALDLLRSTAAAIRSSVEPDLRAIVVAAQTATSDTLDALVTDMGHWRTWCRIMTGWQEPSLRPNVPCPNADCGALPGERAGLRVRIDGASGTGGISDGASVQAAVCLSCDRTWAADEVGVLAEIIRAGSADGALAGVQVP